MGGQVSERSADAVIFALAARQHGVVSRDELLRAGVSRRQIDRRLADGRLRALHRGVYLVGAVPSEFAYSKAALLACGDEAALGCRTALWIWKLRTYPSLTNPWVTVPPGRRIERPGIVITRAPLSPCDVRIKHGMRVASPPRAVLDFAATASDKYELESLVADGHYRRLASEHELRAQIERNPGRPGVPLLRLVLDIEGGPQRTRSDGERWLLRVLREQRISGFEVNAKAAGWEVDFLWREQNFCIELDGWDGHSSRPAFEKDRRKWADLNLAGLRVMPLASRDAKRNKARTIHQIKEMLRHSAA
jgi:very-short-patch-repair endonuclease